MTEFEPLIGAATVGLTHLIGKIIEDNGHGLLNGSATLPGKDWEFDQAAQVYVQRYADRYGALKMARSQRAQARLLDKSYTPVYLLDHAKFEQAESGESIQQQLDERVQRGFEFHDRERQLGIQFANEQPYLMVLGEPHMGKSTFLSKIGIEALQRIANFDVLDASPNGLHRPKSTYTHACIPVMPDMRQLSRHGSTLKDLIIQEFEGCGFSKPWEFVELCLKKGKLLLLLDGIDAISPGALHRAIADIEDLVDCYSNNRFIVSCRTAAYTFGGFKQFQVMAIAAFNDEQIKYFLHQWFRQSQDLESGTAKRFWQQLNNPRHTSTKELAQTPLLLTFLCGIYETLQDFPLKRHSLCATALAILLQPWQTNKRQTYVSNHQTFDLELELELLAEIAYASFVSDQIFFAKQSVLERIEHFQAANENAPNLSAGSILHEIEVMQGILVKRAKQVYSFSHLTLQEYLTAKYIVDNQKVDQLVRDRLTDHRWREVFLFVAGLMPGQHGADDLLLAMEEQARIWLTQTKLRSLFLWADVAIQKVPGDAKNPAKRTMVLTLALALALALGHPNAQRHGHASRFVFECAQALARTLDQTGSLNHALDCDLDLVCARARALASVRNLDHARDHLLSVSMAMSLTHDLIHAFQKLGVISTAQIEALMRQLESLNESPAKEQNSLGNHPKQALQIWLEPMQLSPDLLYLSDSENDAFSRYLYTAELIICCKQSAVRVSPQVWKGIESRLLAVPNDKLS